MENDFDEFEKNENSAEQGKSPLDEIIGGSGFPDDEEPSLFDEKPAEAFEPYDLSEERDAIYHMTKENIAQDDEITPQTDFEEEAPQPAEDPEPVFRPAEPQQTYAPPQQSAPHYEQPQTNYRAPGQQPTQPYEFNRRPSYGPPVSNQPPKKNSKGGLIALIVIICVTLAVAAAFLIPKLSGGSSKPAAPTLSQEQTVTNENGEVQPAESTSAPVQYATVESKDELSAVEIADKCRSSVVGVMTYQNGELSGEGSGVIMGVDSTNTYTYVMTCAHVISSSNVTYGILDLNGKSYEAELVGYDTKTDIGVLKVKDTSLTVAEFGDSTQLKIGETVYAIGNPGGSEYFGSMTEGIVSAIDRTVSGSYNLTSIQHDAAINPGNSGGALVNSKGQVVGINSSKIAATDYEGMGFAVPTSTAVSIANNLISYGYVPNRPKLGITYAAVSEYQVYSMVVAIKGLPSGSLIITGISDDSALKDTDAQVGDMITAVNGVKMDSSSVLLDLIDKGAVGDTLTLTLCRVNSRTYQTTNFDVTIKLVEDRGSETEESTEADSIYDFDNGGSSGGSSGAFGGDFRDFFRDYFGF